MVNLLTLRNLVIIFLIFFFSVVEAQIGYAPYEPKCPRRPYEVDSNRVSGPPPIIEDLEWVSQFGFSGLQKNRLKLVVDSKDNIYLSGEVSFDENQEFCSHFKSSAYIVRYNSKGEPDEEWDSYGYKTFASDLDFKDDFISDFLVDDFDNLYIIFHTYDEGFPIRCEILKYLPNGSLDVSWAVYGILPFNHNIYDIRQVNKEQVCPYTISKAEDGSIFIAGALRTVSTKIDNTEIGWDLESKTIIYKLLNNGDFDVSWGDKGSLVISDAEFYWYNDFGGDFLVIEDYLLLETSNGVFIRITPDAQLDKSWGDEGIYKTEDSIGFQQSRNGNVFVTNYKSKDNEITGKPGSVIVSYENTMQTINWEPNIVFLQSTTITNRLRIFATDKYYYAAGTIDWELLRPMGISLPMMMVMERFFKNGDHDDSWGSKGYKFFGTFDFGEEISGLLADSNGDLIVIGMTGGNLGGDSCNSPGISCSAEYSFVAKIEQ